MKGAHEPPHCWVGSDVVITILGESSSESARRSVPLGVTRLHGKLETANDRGISGMFNVVPVHQDVRLVHIVPEQIKFRFYSWASVLSIEPLEDF